MNSDVINIIDEMEVYIKECNGVPFQSNKVIVRSDIIDEFISKIRIALPEEIKRANAIIEDREHMMSIAKDKLDELKAEAIAEADKLVDRHEIIRRAEEKAATLLDQAYKESHEIRKQAYRYTDELLEEAQKTITELLNQSNKEYSKFEKTLMDQLDLIDDNRESLKAD